jgi:flagellar basal-body rod protein FlgF
MNYGLYLSAAALRVQEYRQDVIANNLANVNTAGFKGDLAVIRGRRPAPQEQPSAADLYVPVLDDVRGGLRSGGTYTNFSQNQLVQTGRDLDVALNGPGFFAVAGDGRTEYTRDGRLERDAQGNLVLAASGRQMLDESGRPIQLRDGRIQIDRDGTVRVNGETQGKLGIVNFANPAALRKAGFNTYVADGAQAETAPAAVVPQCVVGSNVDPTRALVDMLTGQRAYEASARMLQSADTMTGQAVNDIARLV